MQTTMVTRSVTWLQKPVSIAPLVTFRILFGLMMLLSTIRFYVNGWIKTQYVDPSFHFKYLGFEWVKPLSEQGMNWLFVGIAVAALLISLGFLYRLAAVFFFLAFTYVELIDVTYYLNHYYFVSLVSLLLIFLPAHKAYALDAWLGITNKTSWIPRWMLGTIRLQLAIVYIFAGLAKLHADWLLEAQPMKIWLPTKSHLPLIGDWMYQEWVAYLFSWFGAAYDLFIVFFLINKVTRPWAYLLVLVFHISTAIFFPAIGMFPYLMMLSSLVFFSGKFHQQLLQFLFGRKENRLPSHHQQLYKYRKLGFYAVALFFVFQLLIPMRYVLYQGNLFWTEQGYRFSWRVMLMEKAGLATFYIHEPTTGKKFEVNNNEFLTPLQEKMMATQPDLILQYAHFLGQAYQKRGVQSPKVYVDASVALNGRPSQSFIHPATDLAQEKQNLFQPYGWILPYPY